MSENLDTTNVDTSNVSVEQDLDAFEAEFFNPGKAPEPKPTEDTVEHDGDNTPEPTETEDSVEDTTEELEEDSTTDASDQEIEEKPAVKKESRAEKRIRELVAEKRELERLLAAQEQSKKVQPEEPTKPVVKDSTDKAPHWDDEDENGEPIYPLGHLDPKFNADLVRYTIQEENRKLEEQRTQTEQQRKIQEAEQALQNQWEEKLAPARERYPDFVEKGQELVDQFADLDPNYAKYLTDTIRAIDNGPEVLYHLANNLELAEEIVRKGPALATVALGRISAQFESVANTETPTRTKVTNAPPVPPKARGNAAPKIRNLDDLDEFEKAFFG